MFRLRPENIQSLEPYNIRVSQLNSPTMAQQPPKKVIHLPQVRMLGRNRPMPSIRITKVKSVKPQDPEAVKKQEEAKLREQVSKEIESKNRLCAHAQYECQFPVVSGRSHCARHIVEEPGAGYRPCGADHCTAPAQTHHPDRRDNPYCFEHARLAQLARTRATAPAPPTLSTETLVHSLTHYVRAERTRTTSCASSVSVVSEPAELEPGLPHAVDPFKQIDAHQVNAAYTSSILDCVSEDSDSADSVTIGRGGDYRGDDERLSADETELDPNYALRNAGIYTAEEAVCEAKTSLKSLQRAYIRQMGRLKGLLQTARLQYVRSLRTEKEQYCSISSQVRGGALTCKERIQLKKLKAYASYHRKYGAEAVLARKLHRKRAKVQETALNRPIPSLGRCTFTEGGVRCAQHVVPTSKYCHKHILEDKHQVLFVACGERRGDVACREVVARIPLAATCRYHTEPPHYTVFTLKKEDSDSDSEVTNTASMLSQNDYPMYRRQSLDDGFYPHTSLPMMMDNI